MMMMIEKKEMKVGQVLRMIATGGYGFKIRTENQEDAKELRDAFINTFKVLMKGQWEIKEE